MASFTHLRRSRAAGTVDKKSDAVLCQLPRHLASLSFLVLLRCFFYHPAGLQGYMLLFFSLILITACFANKGIKMRKYVIQIVRQR